MEWFRYVWIIFAVFVLYSFGTLGVRKLREGRLHVAAMAASYTLLCWFVMLEPPAAWPLVILVVALLLGVVGLVSYWRRYSR